MATGMVEGRRQFAGILPVLILIICFTSWNRSVNGDNSISIGGLPPLSIPSIPGVPDFRNMHPPTIRRPTFCVFQDATALLNFRAQLSDPRGALSSWNIVTDCCTWRGITCSSSSVQRRVTGLHLSTQGNESDSSFLSVSSQSHGVAGVSLSGLNALQTLSFTSVIFDTDLPSVWGTSLTNLSSLSLVSCAFKGGLPPTFANLRNLRSLCLSDNKLTGQLPLYMTQVFRHLQTLDLSSNSFSGSIQLLFRSNLSSLDLAHNEFDDQIPDLFGFLASLRHLDLSHNRFRGRIPQSLQSVRHLRFLDLSANRLDGSIPSALLAIEDLTSVFLHSNRFSGSIPATFAAKNHIEELDLSNNALSGIIPPTIGALGKLESLDLSFNNLTGGVPDALVLNSQLEFLFLERNELIGYIPPELASLRHLLLANVSHNFLVGPIPGGPWRSFPASSYEGNTGLCGRPLNRCPFTV